MTAPFVRIVMENGEATALGKQPPCKGCGRGFYSCICDPFYDDDEQMPADDVVRIIGEWFPGWGISEVRPLGDGWFGVAA